MKYLSEYFRRNFVKIVGNKTVGDGIKFEKFIKNILECEYKDAFTKIETCELIDRKNLRLGNKRFHPTNPDYKLSDIWLDTLKTHDGGKDFVLVSQNFTIWAECKNYAKNLSLGNIANTLIFAHINNIKEVLIFSCSKLNNNARQNINQFFKHDNKVVRIFDDEILENLIIFHYAKLKKNFPDLPDLSSIKSEIPDFYNVHIYELQLNRDNVSKQIDLIPKRISQVSSTGIIGIDILIGNNSDKSKDFVVDIDFGPDYNFIKLVDNTMPKIDSYTYKLKPHEQKIFSTYYRLSVSENDETIKLPEIKISDSPQISSGELNIIYSDLINFVGGNVGLKRKLESKFKRGSKGVLIYGRSGTGKSRIQKELLTYFAINKFRIIFLNIKEWDIKNSNEETVFKKLLFQLLNIPYNDLKLLKKEAVPSKEIFDILEKPSLLSDPEYFKYFFQQITSTKICLAIDNIQFLNTKILKFLYNLAEINACCGRNLKFVWTMNTDYLVDKKVSEDKSAIIQLFQTNKCYEIKELDNFSDGDAVLFIREVLKCNMTDDISDVKKTICNYSKNPYVLKILLEWLVSNKLIDYHDNKYEISPEFSIENLFAEESDGDCDIKSPLRKIWNYFIELNSDKEEDLLLVAGAVHFLGRLSEKDFALFGLSVNAAKDLCALHFLKQDDYRDGSYVFDHDMVELTLMNLPDKKPDSPNKNGTITELFLKHLGNNRVDFEEYSPFCQRYYLIYNYLNDKSPILTEQDIDKLLALNDFNDLPCNIEKEYLKLYAEFLLDRLNRGKDRIKVLSVFRNIAELLRGKIGAEFLLQTYDSVYKSINQCFDSLVTSDIFGWFNIEYCNYLSDYGRVSDAESAIKKIMTHPFYSNENIKDQFIFLKAYFINRYGLYSAQQSLLNGDNKELTEIFYSSLSLAEKLQEINAAWAAEIRFINYTDLGKLYYYDNKHKAAALKMFESAYEVFKKNDLFVKTMNSFHMRLMIATMKKNSAEAIGIAEEGISYCYKGKYHYYDGYFMELYLILQANAYLMRNEAGDIALCESNLKKVKQIDKLISIKTLNLVLQAEGVCAVYRNNFDVAMDKFLDAYTILADAKNKGHLNERIKQLEFNIYKLVEINYGRDLEKIILKRNSEGKFDDLIAGLNKRIFTRGKSVGNPEGVFTDKYDRFNLPFI